MRVISNLVAITTITRRRIALNSLRQESVCQLESACLHPQRRQASSGALTSHGSLNQTALYELHVSNGGKMVPFGGYSMPVQYSDLDVGESHRWTREKASLFDVGHMVQHRLSGPGAAPLLEKITPSSTASLDIDRSTLSCFLHPATGGIVDDTVITRLGPECFYLVTNAACKAGDLAYLEGQIQSRDVSHGSLEWEVLENWGLVALQGPLSAEILERAFLTAGVEDLDLKALYFGQCKHVNLKLSTEKFSNPGTPILISRGGYTGEDGFEISIPPALTVAFTAHLLNSGGRERLRLAGLGARNSLRLEAGMCLYGHDLDHNITPVEAGLGWIVHKNRRASGGFHGDETILRQLRSVKDGGSAPKHRRVGLIVEGAPAREGAEIIDPASPNPSAVVGRVTSGCPSPTLGKNIAMGYIKPPLHKAGTPIEVLVRGKRRKAEVVKMPFVKGRYFKQVAGGISPG